MIYRYRARRAAAFIICGWVALRLILLWPDPNVPDRAASGSAHVSAAKRNDGSTLPFGRPARGYTLRETELARSVATCPCLNLLDSKSGASLLSPPGEPAVQCIHLTRNGAISLRSRSSGQRYTNGHLSAIAPPVADLSLPPSVETAETVEIMPRGQEAAALTNGLSEGGNTASTFAAVVVETGEIQSLPGLRSVVPPVRPARSSRLSLSSWSIIRPDGKARPLATNGALGASQAGLRARLDLLEPAKGAIVAANLRLSAPLQGRSGREAGLGVSLRPTRIVPVELITEARVALDAGGRDRLAMLVAGGVSNRQLPLGLRLSAYGQAGLVGIRHPDAFADGAITLDRPLAYGSRVSFKASRVRRSSAGAPEFNIGLLVSGGAQPGATRLDAGPTLTINQRLANGGLQLSGSYRWRVAGAARPGSGPALTIGMNF